MVSCKITFSLLVLSSLLILHILPGTFASSVNDQDDAEENKQSVQRYDGLDMKTQRKLGLMNGAHKAWCFFGFINNVPCLQLWAGQVGNTVRIGALGRDPGCVDSGGSFEKDVLNALIEQAKKDHNVFQIAYEVKDWTFGQWDIALVAVGFPTGTDTIPALDEYNQDLSYRVLQTPVNTPLPKDVIIDVIVKSDDGTTSIHNIGGLTGKPTIQTVKDKLFALTHIPVEQQIIMDGSMDVASLLDKQLSKVNGFNDAPGIGAVNLTLFMKPKPNANNNTDNDNDNDNSNKPFKNSQIVMITLAIFMFVALVALAIDFFTGGCMSKPILGKVLFAAASVPASIASYKAASTLLGAAKESGGLGVGAVIAIIFATLFVLAAITGVVFFILHERYGFFRSGFVHVLVVKLKDFGKRDTTAVIDPNQMRGTSSMHSIVVAS
eukprot:814328_1